jgi:DNA-directed RNA polymerase specialized sigma24 family protein
MGVRLPPFQALLDEHRDDVYRFLVASLGRDEADDCFQETFISALRAYPRIRDASNLRSWLFTIAHRKAIDAHRARGRRAVPVEEVPEQAGAGGIGLNGEPELWRAVRGLPAKQRAAVLHRYVNDLAYADIGQVMGCSEDAARRSVHEGLKKLRTVWAA